MVTAQQMAGVDIRLGPVAYFVLRHSPRDLPDTIVNLADASSMTKAMQEATKRDQERERPYSAPALAQTTTVPGPTLQAASIDQ